MRTRESPAGPGLGRGQIASWLHDLRGGWVLLGKGDLSRILERLAGAEDFISMSDKVRGKVTMSKAQTIRFGSGRPEEPFSGVWRLVVANEDVFIGASKA